MADIPVFTCFSPVVVVAVASNCCRKALTLPVGTPSLAGVTRPACPPAAAGFPKLLGTAADPSCLKGDEGADLVSAGSADDGSA